MDEKVVSEIIDKLIGLSERLGFEALRIWPQVVFITFVKSVFWLIFHPFLILLSAGIAIWATKSAFRAWAKVGDPNSRYERQHAENWTGWAGVFWAVCIVILVVGFFTYPGVLAG